MLYCRMLKLFYGQAHAQQCVNCLAHAQETALVEQLLTQRAHRLDQRPYTPSPFFMAKLAARLRAEAEPYVMTWEHALPALRGLRGWMLTFSAAALLLIAAAVTLTGNASLPEENVFTANANESAQGDAFWTGE
ncbi:MAG: hypothetical protein HOP19_08100 [Acidobacteria bacterium]|nr:hypothetical protein [Acidobacteriota bacterium]